MILDIKKIAATKTLKIIIILIIIIAFGAIVFQAGVFVGFHKASFLFKSGDNFYRIFGDKDDYFGMMGIRDDMHMGMYRNEYSSGYGVVGKIVRINLPNLVVLGNDNIEKVVITDDKTLVREHRYTSSINNLASDDYITVLGTPNDQGQIVAKLIRIMTKSQNNIATTTTSINR